MNQDDLRAILRYEEDTGLFYWRSPRCQRWAIRPAGTWHPRGYRAITVFEKRYLIHRLAWFYVHGEWPEQIDHINGVRDDNRLSNLRPATQAQNNANSARRKDNTSGAKGVYFCKQHDRWTARIKPPDGKRLSLGFYKTADEAALAYAEAAKVHFGEYARLT